MNTRNLLMVGAVAAIAAASTAASAANLISNGAFQTGDFTDWTLGLTAQGSAGFPPDPQVTSFDVTGGGTQNAAEFEVGDFNTAFIEEGATLTQSFTSTTGLLNFSADIAALNYNAYSNADAGYFTVSIDGNLQNAVELGGIGLGETLRNNLDFSAPISAGSHTLEIDIERYYGNVPGDTPLQYITNIAADVTALPAAPEPATWALMLVGFGGLGAAMRGRRRTRIA